MESWSLSKSSGVVLGALLPLSCPVCGMPGAAPCATCWRDLRPAPSGPVPVGLDRCRSLLSYEGPGRELIARLKYRNARSAVGWLAAGMAALVSRAVVEAGGAAGVVVTWAPTTPARRRARGYDQAELLARGVAAELALPCLALLRRLPGPPQTGRSRDERWHGPGFIGRGPPDDRAVLLVDDLLTTGATLSSSAAALRASGRPSTIVGLTAARTPRRLPRSLVRADHSGSIASPALKVPPPGADVRGIMAEADRTPRRLPTSVPEGLLAELAAPPVIRLDEVARGRQHAAERAYDDGEVVVEIATQLLSLSDR